MLPDDRNNVVDDVNIIGWVRNWSAGQVAPIG